MTGNHDVAAPAASCVIVVFGAPAAADGRPSATLRRRLDAARRAAVMFPDARIIVTGGAVASALPEARLMFDVLVQAGVSPARVVVEDLARTTLDSAHRVAHLLTAPERRGGVVIVTSGYHVPRCRLCLRMSGLRAVTAITPVHERRAMGALAWSRASLRELVAIPWNCLRAIERGRSWE